MKQLIITIIALLSFIKITAQEKKDNTDAANFEYTPRMYNPSMCGCPSSKEGYNPKFLPLSEYMHDTTLWEWIEIDLGNGTSEMMYDLKPAYKDTIEDYKGDIIEVPIWIKYPNWKKPEEL